MRYEKRRQMTRREETGMNEKGREGKGREEKRFCYIVIYYCNTSWGKYGLRLFEKKSWQNAD
jgi:hypothetical protein